MRRPPPERALVALLASSVLLAGCATAHRPGVGVDALHANVVFGVKDVTQAEVVPPSFPTSLVDQLVPGPAATTADLPPQDLTPPTFKKPFVGPSFDYSGPSECPAAPLNEFPEEAPINVPAQRLPAEGTYKWKKDVQLVVNGNVLPPDTGLEKRYLRRVTPEAADPSNADRQRYTYQTIQPDASTGNYAVTTFHVDTAAPSEDVQSPVSGDRATTGTPERGLVIRSITYIDGNGQAVKGAGFNPSSGLLIAPLPIRTGEQWTSVAVDPNTQQTYRFDGTTKQREQIDACGKMLDGWIVEGPMTVTARGGSFSWTQKYTVAPQLGMVVIADRADGTTTDGKPYYLHYTDGQTTPDALPQDKK